MFYLNDDLYQCCLKEVVKVQVEGLVSNQAPTKNTFISIHIQGCVSTYESIFYFDQRRPLNIQILDCNDDSILVLACQVATSLLINNSTNTRISGDINDILTVSINKGMFKYTFVTAISTSKLLRTFIYLRRVLNIMLMLL